VSAPVLDRPAAATAPLRVHPRAAGGATRAAVLRLLRHEDVVVTAELESDVDALLVAGTTVEEAFAQRPAGWPGARLVVLTDTFSRDGVLHALRAGVTTLLRFATTTPAHLAAGLLAARDGGGRMPHDVLVRLLGGAGSPSRPDQPVTPQLTRRHLSVLWLLAEGFDNATIACSLSCSEHTVKNVVYELMAQLHARNRAHAVAEAVRLGLV